MMSFLVSEIEKLIEKPAKKRSGKSFLNDRVARCASEREMVLVILSLLLMLLCLEGDG